jgi:starch phosphorylase
MHGVASKKLLRPFWSGLLESEVPVDAIVNGVHLASVDQPRDLEGPGRERASDRARGLRAPALDAPVARPARGEARAAPAPDGRHEEALQKNSVERGDSPALLAKLFEGLDPNALWIGFARRFAPYKRAALLFQDPARLAKLLGDPARPVRLVFAGKAHPNDGLGKDLVKKVFELTRRPEFQGKTYFLEDYDVRLSRALTGGVDVWLNTPIRWLEASGTSGMKAAANGTLNLSIGDGWWPEAFDQDNGSGSSAATTTRTRSCRTSFDANALYHVLENEVGAAVLRARRASSGRPALALGWSACSAALATVPLRSTRNRMVRDYFEQGLRAAELGAAPSSRATSAGSSRWSCREPAHPQRASATAHRLGPRGRPRQPARRRSGGSCARRGCTWAR